MKQACELGLDQLLQLPNSIASGQSRNQRSLIPVAGS